MRQNLSPGIVTGRVKNSFGCFVLKLYKTGRSGVGCRGNARNKKASSGAGRYQIKYRNEFRGWRPSRDPVRTPGKILKIKLLPLMLSTYLSFKKEGVRRARLLLGELSASEWDGTEMGF